MTGLPPPRPSLRALGRAWVTVGTQSFGGAASVYFLIRRILIEDLRYLAERDLAEAWALSQLSPGTHIVAFCALVGRRIAGLPGLLVSLLGLLVPAAIITAALAAVYEAFQGFPAAAAALQGAGPVTGGMSIGMAVILYLSVRRRGRGSLADLALFAGAGLALYFGRMSTVPIIVASAVLGAIFLRDEPPGTHPGRGGGP